MLFEAFTYCHGQSFQPNTLLTDGQGSALTVLYNEECARGNLEIDLNELCPKTAASDEVYLRPLFLDSTCKSWAPV